MFAELMIALGVAGLVISYVLVGVFLFLLGRAVVLLGQVLNRMDEDGADWDAEQWLDPEPSQTEPLPEPGLIDWQSNRDALVLKFNGEETKGGDLGTDS